MKANKLLERAADELGEAAEQIGLQDAYIDYSKQPQWIALADEIDELLASEGPKTITLPVSGLKVTTRELDTGDEEKICPPLKKKHMVCPACNGGAIDDPSIEECPVCHGSGDIITPRIFPSEEGIIGVRPRCPSCRGSLKLTGAYIDMPITYKNKLLCNRCGKEFYIKEYWPVPGKEVKP